MPESKKTTRPRDVNQLAKLVVDTAIGEIDERPMTDDGKDLAAVMLGRLGGIKGGRARADSLTSERRAEIARTAARKRWALDRG